MLPSIPLKPHCQNVRKTEYFATRVRSPGEVRDVRRTDEGRRLRGVGARKGEGGISPARPHSDRYQRRPVVYNNCSPGRGGMT